MAEKLEKSIPWLTVAAICVLAIFGLGIVLQEIAADTATPSVTVGNAAPTIGTITLNGGSDITIIENSTTTITGTTTFSDANGYSDVTSVTSTLYLNNAGCSSDVTNATSCYYISSCATSNCSNQSCDVSCSAYVWFIAEATDASSTLYADNVWEMAINVLDSGNNATSGTSGQELNSAAYLDVSGSISYGSVSPAATSSPNQTTNATNTGNSTIDTEFSGVALETGGATSSIATGSQKYATSTIGDWENDAFAHEMNETPTTRDLDLSKPTATTSDSTDSIYWVIRIPTSTNPGVYTGTNTIDAVWVSSP
jgi:hypothetical protein